MAQNVIQIEPFQYIHVLDNNENITRLESGPQTFVRKDHEKIVVGPLPMIRVPPRHFVKILNPVIRDGEGKIVLTDFGQAKIDHGELQIRFEQEKPFALYPGEKLDGVVQK